MAKGRDYAEQLVGPLDRSFYTTQSDVTERTHQTNWDNLQNQYKNLQDKLKREQAEANRAFANGLVNVAENSNDRMSNATDNLARSGLTSSGMKDLLVQGDTTAKGEEVLDLLEKSGDVNVALAESLSEANKTATEKQNELSNQLADVLGDIGTADISAQMDYNKGLANIGEAMEAREDENALAAAERAAKAASVGSSKDLDDAEQELYEKQLMFEIMNSPELDATQKRAYLGAYFGMSRERAAVAYDYLNRKIGDKYYFHNPSDMKSLKDILYGTDNEAQMALEHLANMNTFSDYKDYAYIPTSVMTPKEKEEYEKRTKGKGIKTNQGIMGTMVDATFNNEI